MPTRDTKRSIVPISPAEKKKVEKAQSGKMSTAEFVRRAVLQYDPREQRAEETELRGLIDIFKSVHARTMEQLDRTDRALDRTLICFAEKNSRQAR